jgi:hypothetical protein
MSEPIPDPVQRFLATHIPSVPHLETLLLLWREPERAWPLEAIAARLYVSRDRAERLLEDLCQAQVLDAQVHAAPGAGEANAPARYRFRAEPALSQVLPLLDFAHARRLREVTELIHANANARGRRGPLAAAGGEG